MADGPGCPGARDGHTVLFTAQRDCSTKDQAYTCPSGRCDLSQNLWLVQGKLSAVRHIWQLFDYTGCCNPLFYLSPARHLLSLVQPLAGVHTVMINGFSSHPNKSEEAGCHRAAEGKRLHCHGLAIRGFGASTLP